MTQRYRFRYKIEPGDWPKPTGGDVIRPGIRVMRDDHGYADELFVVSIVGKPGEQTYLLLSTEDGGGLPSREMLLAVREQIDHYLNEHA